MAEPPLSTTTTTTTTTVTDVPEAEEVVINSPPSTTATVEAPPVAAEAAAVNGETAKVMAVEAAAAAEEAAVVSTSADVENEKDTKAKALAELKLLIQNALNNHELTTTAAGPSAAAAAAVAEGAAEAEEAKTETQPQEVVVPSESQEDGKAVDIPKEQANPAEPQEEVIKKVNIDEDGTKTVEAIEETIVSSSTAPQQQQQQPLPPQEAVSAAGVCLLDDQQAKTLGAEEETTPTSPEEVSIWGVPLLKDNRTDTVLWKFLLARDFRVKDAFAMIKSTIKWRKEFGIDSLVDHELVHDHDDGALAKTTFMEGVSKDGNPVCYNVYGAFQNKELYQKTFSDEEKRGNFLKWRVQLLEKSVRKLDFVPGGISTIVQVNDLKNCPGPTLWELRQALLLLQDNYPEFVAKQVFINVPWWYMAVKKMISPFLTQRTKSKFVVAGPSKSAETLFSYIAPEQVPVQYGGLSRSEGEFGTKHGVTQIIVKPTSKETVEFAVTEACHLTWEVRVLGWEVNYGAEFVPNAKESYTVIIQKIRKVGATEETIISNSFKTSEPGKVILTIDNASSKKKRLLYRLKSNPSSN